MRKIKWLLVYPVGLVAIALTYPPTLRTAALIVTVTVFLILIDWGRAKMKRRVSHA